MEPTHLPMKLKFLCDSNRHLICEPYSIANLHAMAAALGIKRWWFSGDHYDIPERRIMDVMNKCQIVSTREIIIIIGRANPGPMPLYGDVKPL